MDARRTRSGSDPASTRGQGGFALMIVLAVIALTSLIVVALIGLAFTTVQTASAQAESARRTRSADGALESAVATMAGSADDSLCPGLRDGSVVSFDNGTEADHDDDDVVLSCGDAAVSMDPSAPVGGNDVKVVGASGSTLTSAGSAALRFDADVTVRRGAGVATTADAGPAVALTGQYVQGSAGPGGSGSDCTTLSPTGGRPDRSIQDRDATPVCGAGSAAALSVSPQQLVNIDDPVAAPARAVPNSCPAGPLIEFAPGRYDALQTSTLNQLMSGSCPNKVFWFRPSTDAARPSVFAFDANPNRTGGAALLINDPTARVIFGRPAGGGDAAAATAATFPDACDRTAAGASIQLSGRMALRHQAGRLAVCPAWNGTDPLPALVQVPTASVDPVTTVASSTDFLLAHGQNGGPALLARPDDSSIEASAMFSCAWNGSNNTCSKSFDATFANVPASSSLQSVKLMVSTRETPPAPWPTVQRGVVIQLRSAAGAVVCTSSTIEGGRTNWQISSYDLMTDSACRTALAGRPSSVLEGASVNVRYTYGPDGCPVTFDFVYGWTLNCGERLSIRGVRLGVDTATIRATSAGGSNQTDANAVLADDSSATRFPQVSCGITAFPCSLDEPGTTRDLEVTGFQPPSGWSGQPSSLRLLIKNSRTVVSGQSWVSDPIDDSSTQIRLTLADGSSCTVTSSGYSHSAQESQYDLLRGAPSCAGLVSDLSQLQGASVRIRYTSGCAWFGGGRAPIGADGRCATVTAPEIQYVALTATTSSVAPPPASMVSVNLGASTDAHVFGAMTAPESPLEIRWNGTVDPDDTPLFFGSMVVGSLDSRMAAGAQMGVVCCDRPRSDRVRVQAAVDGQTRAVAILTVAPRADGAPGHLIGIQDWQLCIEAACRDVSSSTGPP